MGCGKLLQKELESLSDSAKETAAMLYQGFMGKSSELLMKLTAIQQKLVTVYF